MPKKITMKKIYLLPLAVLAMGLSFTKAPGDPLVIGSAMPNATIKMKDISGKELSLADAKKANGLLVMFSCNTCPYVIKNQDRTKTISAYALKQNMGVVVVNSNAALRSDADSYEAMKAYAKAQGYQWNYVVDENSALADAFGANRTPECFLFDKDSKLVYHGAIDNSAGDPNNITREHLKEAINETVAGKAVTVKESRSVGCTIKRRS
jgi:thioredoxin-related protein